MAKILLDSDSWVIILREFKYNFSFLAFLLFIYLKVPKTAIFLSCNYNT